MPSAANLSEGIKVDEIKELIKKTDEHEENARMMLSASSIPTTVTVHCSDHAF